MAGLELFALGETLFNREYVANNFGGRSSARRGSGSAACDGAGDEQTPTGTAGSGLVKRQPGESPVACFWRRKLLESVTPG